MPQPYQPQWSDPVPVTPPGGEPLTIAEVKGQLRETAADATQDAVITRLITAVRRSAEAALSRSFLETEWDTFGYRFPCGDAPIRLPLAPLRSVTSITYVADDGAETTLAASVYLAHTQVEPGEISLREGQSWPSVRARGTVNLPRPIRVRFMAGYGAKASDVPATLRVALLMSAAHLFNQREAFTEEAPLTEVEMAVRSFLSQYHVFPY